MSEIANNRVEALEWLSGEEKVLRSITGGDGKGFIEDDALSFVQRLYALGAIKVWAVDIQRVQGDSVRLFCQRLGVNTDILEDTDEVLVDLPRDREKRREIFAFYNALFVENGVFSLDDGDNRDKSNGDTGQDALLFWWP